MAKTRLTPKKLRKLYDLLDVPMIDFDCGKLCAPKNNGVPACCDVDQTVPVLFVDEYKWHKKKSKFWKKLPLKRKDYQALANEIDPDKDVLAMCPGCDKCDRDHRALVCRTFPFEPHTDEKGNILGLTYNYENRDECPLIGREDDIYNPDYIRNCLQFWTRIFEIFPEEEAIYIEESAKLRKRFKKTDRPIPLFH